METKRGREQRVLNALLWLSLAIFVAVLGLSLYYRFFYSPHFSYTTSGGPNGAPPLNAGL